MKEFCNAQTFANNYDSNEEIKEELCRLMLFTTHPKSTRNSNEKFLSSDIVISNTTSENYIFKYNGKTYPFSVFSDKELQKYDKKILESEKRTKSHIGKSLKLACSMNLVNPRIAIGYSIVKIFETLIVFQENGIDKVIDYTKNLIMIKKIIMKYLNSTN